MAKSRIEGITIEIDGNTGPLKAALGSVNKTLGDTKVALRDVDRLLKLDPGNTDLLAQKQQLLSEAIETTEEKLKQLKLAQQQAQTQLEKGDLGKERYDALQREIIATETSLKDLKTQADKTDSALSGSSNGLASFSSAAEKASNAAKTASEKVSGLSKAAGTLLTAAVATVPATTELNRDLSFLYSSAKEAGVGIKATEKAFKTFNAVSGETDSSVEAVSNLLQAGFTTSNLQLAVEGLAGAATRFPDTLKIEGLADGLQETLATGAAIGPFAELLDRLGIGADNFSKKLEKCTTEAEKQDLALQTLAEAGLIESYKGWAESNEELVEYETAVLEAQMALKNFAKTISPVVTQVTKFATKAVEGYNNLSPAAQKAALAFTAITAATGPTLSGIGKVAGGISTLTEKLGGASTGAQGLSAGSKVLSDALKAVPYAAVAAGVTGLAVAIYKGIESMNAETAAANEAAKARSKAVESVKTETEKTDLYFQKLKELEAVEDKSATQKELMQKYVDKLNKSVEDLNLSYDSEKDKLSQSTDAIYKKIEAQKQEAIQAAYMKQAKKALEDYAETQIKLAETQADLAEKEEAYQTLLDKGSSITYDEAQQKAKLGEEINALSREMDDLTTASDKYNREAQKLTNQAELQGEAWNNLLEDAEMTAEEIPKALIEGLESGQYAVPKSVEELNELIEFTEAVENATGDGKELAKKLSEEIANGKTSVSEATKKLTAANAAELEKGTKTAGQKGNKTKDNFINAIKSGVEASQAAGKTISDASNTGLASADTASTGKKKGTGFTEALKALKKEADAAGLLVSTAAKDAMDSVSTKSAGSNKGTQFVSGVKSKEEASETEGKNLSKKGRSGAEEISWKSAGENAGKGYVKGLKNSIKSVAEAAEAVAEAALNAAKKAAKEGSPAKEWIKSAEFAGEGYAIGFHNSVPLVEKAGETVADAALSGASKANNAISGFGAADFSSMKSQIKTELDYSRLGSIIKASVADMEFTILLDQRELGRGLRGMGVQFQ